MSEKHFVTVEIHLHIETVMETTNEYVLACE